MADDEPNFEIVSRKDAVALGLRHYFTGQPCARGHLDRRYVSGLRCVSCATDQRKSWRSENPERSRELRRQWHHQNPDKEKEIARKARAKLWDRDRGRLNKERRNARQENPFPFRQQKNRSANRLYLENPDRFSRITKEWRAKNPEKYRKSSQRAHAKWLAKNPLAPRAKASKRRALKRRNGGEYTQGDVLEILKMQRGKCAYCRNPVGKKYHIDHIIPLSKGGRNDRKNIQVACVKCNLEKAARDPIDYAKTHGMLI